MALDRWIALVLLAVCLVYGYTAWFAMDDMLAPFMRRKAIWPSSFPKILSVGAIAVSLLVIFGFERNSKGAEPELDLGGVIASRVVQACVLLGLMVVYALALRPMGFLLSTFVFLSAGFVLLGERRVLLMGGVAAVATGSIWYLVQKVLGIFLRPYPWFL